MYEFVVRRSPIHFWFSILGGILGSCAASVLLQYFSQLTNIRFYLVLCVAFCASTAFVFLMPCSLFTNTGLNKKVLSPFVMTSIALFIALLFLCADNLPLNTWGIDIGTLPWHSAWYRQLIGYIIALVGAHFLCSMYKRTYRKQTVKYINRVFYAYAFFIALLCAFFVFQPNVTSGFDVRHRHVYFFDIYNVYSNTPYSNITSGIYGHYGLFFAPLLRLLGGCTVENVTLLVSGVSLLSSLLFSLTIANMSKNPVLRFVLPLAMTLAYVFLLPNIYYQGFPSRILPSALFCYAVSFPKKNRIWRIAWRLSAVFALLWSTDMGLVYIFAALLFDSLRPIIQQRRYKTILRNFLTACLWASAEIASAIIIVNLYNLSLGGKPILRAFFWPFGSTYNVEYGLFDSSKASYLQFSFLYAYFWIFIFLIGCLFFALYRGIRDSAHNCATSAYLPLMAASIYGLGSMVYYVNRPAYGNLFMVLPSFLFCLAILIEGSFIGTREQLSRPVRASQYLMLSLTIFLAVGTVLALPNTIKQVHEKQGNPPYHLIAAKALQKVVPKNTYAAGVNSFEVYSALGWDSLCRCDDIHAILNPDARQRLYDELRQQSLFVDFGNFLFSLDEKTSSLISSAYEVVETYNDGTINWIFYRLKGKDQPYGESIPQSFMPSSTRKSIT